MAMTLKSRRELYKLRELVHFLLYSKECYFCRKPILPKEAMEFIAHGNSVGPAKFVEEVSIHHEDGDHDNNTYENKKLCHRKCHKSYHRRMANLERAKE